MVCNKCVDRELNFRRLLSDRFAPKAVDVWTVAGAEWMVRVVDEFAIVADDVD